ncbi:hypothetical protein CsSME_00027873 [Camellia sinensis var. sinensis]
METLGSDQINQMGEKHVAKCIVKSPEESIDKRQGLELFSSDLAEPFVIQPRMKNAPVLSSGLAIKDPVVALSVASVLSLPSDKAAFHAESDVVSNTLVVQLAILAAGRITEIGRRHYNVVERLGVIEVQLQDERNKVAVTMADLKMTMNKAEAEAKRVEEERAKATAEEQKARSAEEWVANMDSELKLAEAENLRLMAELEEAEKARE